MNDDVEHLTVEVVPTAELEPALLEEVLAMCVRAYDREDIRSLYALLPPGMHVIGYLNRDVASHAMWVTRWLQVGDGPLLRTAYVEMVATEPYLQRRGFATSAMRRLQESIQDFDLAALWPNYPEWYRSLGWVEWHGRLFIRTDAGLQATPNDQVMIYRLAKTPPLDLDANLSAELRPGELW